MAFDRYMLCPGGTGKKIKFCCDDLISELEIIQKMMEGEQRLACHEHIEKTLAKYPDRACLLSVKALLEQQLDDKEALAKTLDQFEAAHPDNPLALAERAIATAADDAVAAIEILQEALEVTGTHMPPRVYEALGVVGQALLGEGQVLAARAHLLLQGILGGKQDQRAISLLMSLMRSAELPLPLKEEHPFLDAPEGVDWKKPFDEAIRLADQNLWLSAVEALEDLEDDAADSPEFWRNLAVLRSWIGQTADAAEAWRKYASLDIPFDDAVEAESLAQLIDPERRGDMLDLISATFTVSDFDSLMAQTTVDRRAQGMPVDLSKLSRDGQPPPRAAFYLLDRPMPETGVDIAREDIPIVLGQCFLYGRETDREARIEFVAARNDAYDDAVAALQNLCGSAFGEKTGEETISETSRFQDAMSLNLRLPPDTPPEHRQSIAAAHREDVILNKWSTLPHPALRGKSAEEAAKDPKLRAAVLGAILNIELSSHGDLPFDFNRLRRKLGLPESHKIDPWNTEVSTIPLVRLARLDVLKLSDDDLLLAYERASMMSADEALRSLAEEAVSRESLNGKVDKAEAYAILADLTSDSDKALGFIQKAQTTAKEAGTSPAQYCLEELEVRIARGDFEEFQTLLRKIQTRYINEPGISAGLSKILVQYGLLTPDGRPVAGTARANQPASTVAGEEPAAPAAEIWTPDGGTSGGEKKQSAIWTPDD